MAIFTKDQERRTMNLDGWIPVTERLPKPWDFVLVSTGDKSVEMGRCEDHGIWELMSDYPELGATAQVITHWMPLPAPPASKE